MKVLVNSKDLNGISYLLHQQGLNSLSNVYFNDFANYQEYDVVLFFKYNLLTSDLEKAKDRNNNLLIGIIDPRQNLSKQFRRFVDFIVVDSIEMRDFYSYLRKPILNYYEFQNTLLEKKSKKGEIIHIGYHGNKVHLLSMYPTISSVIRELSKKYSIKLLLLYNHKTLGKLPNFITEGIDIEYLQWNKENLNYFLDKTDIGIVPNFTPISFNKFLKFMSVPFRKTFVTHSSDYLVRYKMTSGPNRILLFALNKIPVVSDMYPSACQLIEDEFDGFLANSSHGWYDSIEKLIKSKKLRKTFSAKMHQKFERKYNYKIQNEFFYKSLKHLTRLKNENISREYVMIQTKRTIAPQVYFIIKEFYAQLKGIFIKLFR